MRLKSRQPVARAPTLIVVPFAAVIAAAGCSSTSTIDTAFADVAQTAPAPQSPANDIVPAIALRDTGTFPNINVEPDSRLQPLGEAEQAQAVAAMQALAADHAAGRLSTAAYRARAAQLQRLAASHSAETLARIEGR